MEKEPFEKVRSLVERKKILESLVREKNQVVCKGTDESLFYFQPSSIIGSSAIVGTTKAITRIPKKNVEIVGNFVVDSDRFFFKGPLNVNGGIYQLPLTVAIFKLQRRIAVRVKVPSSYPIAINVYKVNEVSSLVATRVLDLSAGGVRIKVVEPKSARFNVGDQLSIAVHPSQGRVLELGAVIKHVLQAGSGARAELHYGCEFVTSSTVTKNRLLALSLELQQKIIKGLEG